MAKKAAKKPPGNATKGAKAPFAKPRKAPAAKKKPEGMTEDQWQQDCLRRKLSTAERKGRRAVELEKKAQAARQHQHVMAGCIAATNASPWSTSMPVYVPGVISPSQAAFYNDGPSATPGCVTPNLSPHYQDALPHGGFNPNNLYSPAYEQREPGPGPDGDPFTGRRGPLEYDGADAEEDDGVEEEDDDEEEGVEDDEEDDDEDEEGGEEEDDDGAGDDDLVEVDADGVRTKKKKKKKASGTRGPKWTPLEDLCLCESWATVSHDSIIGANQKGGKYWARIKAEFDERKLINSDYNKVTMKRSQKAMSTRWAIIQASVNSFHGYHHDLETRGDSGADVAKLFDRAMDLYAKNSEGHKSFVLMHCYGKLKMNEKWRLTRLSLSKGKDVIDPDAPLATSTGRPTGNKAAKAALADTASSEKTQASITKCLADVSSTFISRDKKADQRWAELLKRQEEKLELKKRRDDMSLLRTSTEGMSPRTRAAHNFFKGQILDDIEAKMAAADAAALAAASASAAAAAQQEQADASSTATPASASASATEQTHHAQEQADRDEVVVLDGPSSTQDTTTSPNPFPFF
nr:uncharacterized protein LOC127317464 [Lolium perenne]